MRTTSAYINGKPVIKADVSIDQDHIDITTEYEPDPTWTHVDSNGHFHAYAAGNALPTLDAVSVEQPCDGEECGGVCGGEGYTRTEYYCRICNEIVEPKSRRTSGRKYMPGLTSWYVEVEMGHAELLDLIDRQVSFWTTGGRGYFGVGHMAFTSISSDGTATATIHGIGELGQRGSTTNPEETAP